MTSSCVDSHRCVSDGFRVIEGEYIPLMRCVDCGTRLAPAMKCSLLEKAMVRAVVDK